MARLTAAQISTMKQFFAQIGAVDSSWIVGDIDVSQIDGKDNWFTTLFDMRLLAQAPALVTDQGAAAVAAADAAQAAADQALAEVAALVTVPPGAVLPFAMETPPTGWLECDGAEISREDYDALFVAIGVAFGAGDGTTTFNVPDLRGQFVRGWDHGAAVDPDSATRTGGDAVGSAQADGIKAHTHSIGTISSDGTTAVREGAGADTTMYTGSTGGNETRPKNVYLMYCIKV